MKKNLTALYISACIMASMYSCQKTQDATPAQSDLLTQTGEEEILASENGVATVSRIVSGDNVTLTLQPGAINGQDAMILRYDPDPSYVNLNKGQEVDIPSLVWTAGGIPTYRRSLIQFNQLSLIPTGATIVSASLKLYGLPANSSPNCPQGNSPGYGFQENTEFFQALSSPWSENTVTWATQPSVTGGAITVPSTSTNPLDQWNVNRSINITTFVQSWVTNPSQNNGLLMYLKNETPLRSITYGSSENSVAYRPKLVVVFHL